MWYYRHSFSRRFDDDRNLNASFSKSQNFISFHCIDHTIQIRVKVALNIPTVSKLHPRFC